MRESLHYRDRQLQGDESRVGIVAVKRVGKQRETRVFLPLFYPLISSQSSDPRDAINLLNADDDDEQSHFP